MKIANKITLIFIMNMCFIFSYSQKQEYDTVFSYKPSNQTEYVERKLEKWDPKVQIKKKYLKKEGIEITEMYFSINWDALLIDKRPKPIYFTNNPEKFIFGWVYDYQTMDINTYKCKSIELIGKEPSSWIPSIYDISKDKKSLWGEHNFIKYRWEYDTEKEIVLSKTRVYKPEVSCIQHPSNSQYLYYDKGHKLFVYDCYKGEDIKKYNLNCKVNLNEEKPSAQATLADLNNMENKIYSLQALNAQDVNSFGKDFITEGALNILNSIPEWPEISSYAIQPNGNKLIVSYKGAENPGLKELFVWKIDKNDPTIIHYERPWTILYGHTAFPSRILFSNNGNYLATHSNKEGIIWDANTGKIVGNFNDYPSGFSDDGNLLMTVKTIDGEIGEYNKNIVISFYCTADGSLVKTTTLPFRGKYFTSKFELSFGQPSTNEMAYFAPNGTTYAVSLGRNEKLDGKFCQELIIVKDYSLASIALKGNLLNNFNISISNALLNAITKYSNKINNELASLNSIGVKGEFESTEKYNQRLASVKTEPLKIISKYWIKQFEIDTANKFIVSLDSIGRYDADKNEYPVYFKGTEAKIPIIAEEAQGFKEKWWQSAKVEGSIGYFNNTNIPIIQRTKIKNSASNKAYPIIITKQVFAEFMKN